MKKMNKAWARKRAQRRTEQPLAPTVREGKAVRPSVALRAAYERELVGLLGPALSALEVLVGRLRSSTEPTLPASGQHLVTDAAKRKNGFGNWREYIASGKWLNEQEYYDQFDAAAMRKATWYARRVMKNTNKQWNASMGAMGFPEFQVHYSKATWENMAPHIAENARLIKSIPREYVGLVKVAVRNNLNAGGDLQALTARLEKIKGITLRRAAFIARDQLTKATQEITRQREREHGVTEGIWVHSLARKFPRHSHIEAGRNRVRFKLDTGAWLKDDSTGEYRYQLPGQEPNCGCTHRPILVIGGEEF